MTITIISNEVNKGGNLWPSKKAKVNICTVYSKGKKNILLFGRI